MLMIPRVMLIIRRVVLVILGIEGAGREDKAHPQQHNRNPAHGAGRSSKAVAAPLDRSSGGFAVDRSIVNRAGAFARRKRFRRS
jgi:hypothetical protein